MRINILLPNFGERPIGGFKIAYIYANYFAKAGHKVTIVHAHRTYEDSMIEFLKDWIGVFIYRPNWFRFRKGIRRVYCYHLSSRTVPKADVTIATSWRTAVILNEMENSKGKKVYLIQGYEVWDDAKKNDVEATWLYDMQKVVVSKWLYNLGKEMGAQKLNYIPNSIDFRKYRLKRPVFSRGNTISMLYSDDMVKNSRMGIDALKIVREHIPGIQAKFFGKSPRNSRIPGWIQYFENPDQTYLVDEIYNSAGIFLCTSYTEGFGLPPMEAMACGAALISTKNGGVEDFAIDGETALLCDANDAQKMADLIEKLLLDRALRIRIAKSRYHKVHEFKWKDSFEKFERLIRL